jgi:hypothetical protein
MRCPDVLETSMVQLEMLAVFACSAEAALSMLDAESQLNFVQQ